MTTQQELDALKALAEDATPGPWEVEHHSGILVDGVSSTCAVLTSREYDLASFGDELQGYFDAAFIAAAREAVPALIAEVERLRGAWSAEHDAYIRADEQARMAKREVESLSATLSYIDTHAPRADASCAEPGITLSEAARRAMAEA